MTIPNDSYLNCLKPPTWFAGNLRSSMARDLSWVPANGMQDQQKGDYGQTHFDPFNMSL